MNINPQQVRLYADPDTAWPKFLSQKRKLAEQEGRGEPAPSLALLQNFSAGTDTREDLATNVIRRQFFCLWRQSNTARSVDAAQLATAAALFVASHPDATLRSCLCYFAEAAARKEAASSTLTAELRLLHDTAAAADAISADIARRMRALFIKHGLVADTGALRGLAEWERCVTRANTLLDEWTQPMREQVYQEAGAEGVDSFRYNANEIVRFLMLLQDRTHSDDDAYTRVSDFLLAMPSSDRFTDDDVRRFVMR